MAAHSRVQKRSRTESHVDCRFAVSVLRHGESRVGSKGSGAATDHAPIGTGSSLIPLVIGARRLASPAGIAVAHGKINFGFPHSVLLCLRNRGMSHGRAGSLSVAETLRAGTVPGVSSPVLRSSASGVAGIFGGARKVEVRTCDARTDLRRGAGAVLIGVSSVTATSGNCHAFVSIVQPEREAPVAGGVGGVPSQKPALHDGVGAFGVRLSPNHIWTECWVKLSSCCGPCRKLTLQMQSTSILLVLQDLYDVREMIGHGTSGEVRRAINRTTGKQVAVKVR